MRRLALALLLSSGIASYATADVRQLLPVDEAVNHPSFSAYRQQIAKIVEQRDAQALMEHVSAKVKVSFGPGGEGREAFIEQWRPYNDESSLWTELAEVLNLGGQFMSDEEIFCAPYIYSAFPDDLDPINNQVVIEERVAAHAEPGIDSEVVGYLGYAIVETGMHPRTQEDASGVGWTRIRLDDGAPAYVRKKALRSPLDHRACFAQSGDNWQMTAFVAGD